MDVKGQQHCVEENVKQRVLDVDLVLLEDRRHVRKNNALEFLYCTLITIQIKEKHFDHSEHDKELGHI